MSLTTLLRLQITYLLFGLSYNIISLGMMHYGVGPLSATSSVTGIAVMAAYGLFLIPGYLHYHTLYKALMFVAFIVLGYGGVISHLLNITDLHLYYSFTTWIIAIFINFFGLSLNVLAFSGKFIIQRNTRNTLSS